MSGFPRIVALAEERGLPFGEMISRGEVEFEAREKVWKRVESAHFPLFEGMRVRTGEGVAFVALTDDSQIEVGHDSLFALQGEGQFHLARGQVSFRIPAGVERLFRVGELFIAKPYPIQASKSPLLVSPRSEETVGSATLHSNGALTVRGVRGPLSIQNQDRVVLASISPGESVTMPSTLTSGDQGVMLAQAGTWFGSSGSGPLGFESWNMFWLSAAAGAAVAVGIGFAAYAIYEDDDDDIIIVSP